MDYVEEQEERNKQIITARKNEAKEDVDLSIKFVRTVKYFKFFFWFFDYQCVFL